MLRIRRSIYFTRLSEKGQQFRRIKREQRKLAALKKHNRPRHISLISKKTRQKNRMAGMLSRTHHVLSSKNPCSSQSEGSGEASRRHRVTVNKSVRHAIRSRGLLDVGGRRKMFDQWITVNSSSELLGWTYSFVRVGSEAENGYKLYTLLVCIFLLLLFFLTYLLLLMISLKTKKTKKKQPLVICHGSPFLSSKE